MRLSERDTRRMGRVVMTEEALDHMAERFRRMVLRGVTAATFEQYVANPDYYDALEEAVMHGYALHRDDKNPGWVAVAAHGS